MDILRELNTLLIAARDSETITLSKRQVVSIRNEIAQLRQALDTLRELVK